MSHKKKIQVKRGRTLHVREEKTTKAMLNAVFIKDGKYEGNGEQT